MAACRSPAPVLPIHLAVQNVVFESKRAAGPHTYWHRRCSQSRQSGLKTTGMNHTNAYACDCTLIPQDKANIGWGSSLCVKFSLLFLLWGGKQDRRMYYFSFLLLDWRLKKTICILRLEKRWKQVWSCPLFFMLFVRYMQRCEVSANTSYSM